MRCSVAGELVTGNIVCEATGPISANGIDLKISGYEKTEWHDMKHRTEIIRPAEPPSGDNPGRPAETRQIPVFHRHRGKKTFFVQVREARTCEQIVWGRQLAPAGQPRSVL